MFEWPIAFRHSDCPNSACQIDLHRATSLWESKKLATGAASNTIKAFEDSLLKARQLAEVSARTLPTSKCGRPLKAGRSRSQ